MSTHDPVYDQDAHHVTAPNGNRFITKCGPAPYNLLEGYTVEKVRGHDDEQGRGFRITSRQERRDGRG